MIFRFLFILFLSSFSFSVFSQFDNNYEPIMLKGPIPEEFLQNVKEKTNTDMEKEDSLLNKSEQKEYYTINNYSVKDFLLNSNLYFNDSLTILANKIKDNLIVKSPELKKYSIYISSEGLMNALSLGENIICLDIGIFSRVDNEAQIAYIIGHEIAHCFLKHQKKDFKKYKANTKFYQNNGFTLADFYNDLKYSRDAELNADKFSIELMAKSNYSLNEIIPVLKKLKFSDFEKNQNNQDLFNFFNKYDFKADSNWLFKGDKVYIINNMYNDTTSTHPSLTKRIANAEKIIIELNQLEKNKFLFNESIFNYYKNLSEFEIIESNLKKSDYTKAFYQALELLYFYPDNIYLKKVLTESLFWIYYYKKIGKYLNIALEYKFIYDPGIKKVMFTLEKMNDKNIYNFTCLYLKKEIEENKNVDVFLIHLARLIEIEEGLLNSQKYYKEFIEKYPNSEHTLFAKNKIHKN